MYGRAEAQAATCMQATVVVHKQICFDLQVYYVVDTNSDGTPDYSGQLLSDIDTPTGVAVRGQQLFVSGFQNGKGMIWRLDDVHEYALQNKVSISNCL